MQNVYVMLFSPTWYFLIFSKASQQREERLGEEADDSRSNVHKLRAQLKEIRSERDNYKEE